MDTEVMKSSRLEAFSDGVLAIVITIMVLELKAPDEASWEALWQRAPVFISYLLSFIYLAIYWNNHHHLFQATERVNGAILWANLHLLFWLSLIPFTTSWVGQNYTAAEPMALYGLVLLMCAVAYFILHRTLWNFHEEGTLLRQVSERGRKEWISMLLYALAIWLAYLSSWLSIAVYVLIAILWIRPNRSLEKRQLRDDKR